MYWYKQEPEFLNSIIYQYFHYSPLGSSLQIRTKLVDTHEEFHLWYEQNKSL